MEFRKYYDPKPLPKVSKEITTFKGDGEQGIPNTYRLGNRTVTGIELGPKPVGRIQTNDKGELVSNVGKRKGYSLPGANKAILGYIKKPELKTGGTNPYGWDKDDIHPFDRLRGVTVQDLENAENTDHLQRLREKYKGRRFAGEAIGPQFGDRIYENEDGIVTDSVQERINMMNAVEAKKASEPKRLRQDLEAASDKVDSINLQRRIEDNQNLKFGYLVNQQIDADKLRYSDEQTRKAERQEDIEREDLRYKDKKLQYEAELQRQLSRDKEQLNRQERMDNFMIREYEDRQDRLDRAEKREDRRANMELGGAIFNALGSFFY
tara:strand:+ start:80 stop:1045 length:966 start_codon:yes stop_codon:yes gene_type:complete